MVDSGIEGCDGCDGWLSVAGVCDGEPGVRACALLVSAGGRGALDWVVAGACVGCAATGSFFCASSGGAGWFSGFGPWSATV